jgi:hypothetical protein
MNWNDQVEILNKKIRQFNTELFHFEKHTNISEFVNKFDNIILENQSNFVKLDLDLDLNNNFTFHTPCFNIQTNETKIKQNKNLFGNFKIKRKHLMKKIHPDKLVITMEKIKNIIKNQNLKLFESCDFDEESTKISQCVIKMLSENLNIMDCLKLLNSNTKLFGYICMELKMSPEHIDKLGSQLNDFTNICSFSNANFSSEIIDFVNKFNSMAYIESLNKQILLYLHKIYEKLVIHIKKNIYEQIINKKKIIDELKKEKTVLSFRLEISKLDSKFKFDNECKKELEDEITKTFENINVLDEQMQMFTEDNSIYLVGESVLSELNLGNFIEIYKDISEKNKLIYMVFKELENKLPIFYEFVSNIKGSYYKLGCDFPYYFMMEDKFEYIVNQEIFRTKFNI